MSTCEEASPETFGLRCFAACKFKYSIVTQCNPVVTLCNLCALACKFTLTTGTTNIVTLGTKTPGVFQWMDDTLRQIPWKFGPLPNVSKTKWHRLITTKWVFKIHSRQQHLQRFSHVERLLYRICVQGWGGGEDSSNSSQKRLFESPSPPSGCYSVTFRRKWSARFQNKGHSHSRVVLWPSNPPYWTFAFLLCFVCAHID